MNEKLDRIIALALELHSKAEKGEKEWEIFNLAVEVKSQLENEFSLADRE
mgnify:FL=1